MISTESPVLENSTPGSMTRCALKADDVPRPEMVAAGKLSQQLRTESCVAYGNVRCEA